MMLRTLQISCVLALALANVASMLAMIASRHDYRQASTALARLTRARDELNTTFGRLQLEQATWAQTGRIDRLARERLHMHVPGAEDTVVVQP